MKCRNSRIIKRADVTDATETNRQLIPECSASGVLTASGLLDTTCRDVTVQHSHNAVVARDEMMQLIKQYADCHHSLTDRQIELSLPLWLSQ